MNNNCKNYKFYVLSSNDDPENIRYVGVTTKKINERFSLHKYCAMHPEKRGLPVHKWMFSKYEKGGSILFKLIDECSEIEWEEKEKFWIDYYKNLGYDLMNLDKGGHGVITKEKRNKSSIQRSIEGHEIPIVALNMDGSFYKEFESAVKATQELGKKYHTNICNALTGWSKSAFGYIWVYKKDYDPTKQYKYTRTKLGRYLYEFDHNGTLLKRWENKTKLDKVPGYSLNGVNFAINNKTLYHDHYWSHSENINIEEFEKYYKYLLIDTKTKKEKKFKSLADINRFLNISSTSIVCIAIKEHKLIHNRYIVKKI